jgi:hypothetical protein
MSVGRNEWNRFIVDEGEYVYWKTRTAAMGNDWWSERRLDPLRPVYLWLYL